MADVRNAMGETQSQWKARMLRIYGSMLDAGRERRKEKTVEISAAWKVGYAALKADNDRMQAERDVWWRDYQADQKSKLAALVADFPNGTGW